MAEELEKGDFWLTSIGINDAQLHDLVFFGIHAVLNAKMALTPTSGAVDTSGQVTSNPGGVFTPYLSPSRCSAAGPAA